MTDPAKRERAALDVAEQPSRRRWVLASAVGVVVWVVVGLLTTQALGSMLDPGSSVGIFPAYFIGGLATGFIVGARTIERWFRAFVAVFLAAFLVGMVVAVFVLGTSPEPR